MSTVANTALPTDNVLMAIQKKTKKTLKKVSKALRKASGLHAAQAKTLDAIKMKSGGTVMVQGRGCGAMMDSKLKKTRVPRG